jgi:hypothetical protein
MMEPNRARSRTFLPGNQSLQQQRNHNATNNGGVTVANLSKPGIIGVILVGTLLPLTAVAYSTGFWQRTIAGLRGTDSAVAEQTSQAQAIAASSAIRPKSSVLLGLNIHGMADWSREWAFVDVFKQSRSWVAQREGAGWGEGEPLALTPEGWVASLKPGQYAETVMLTGGNYYPTGKYTLLYDGEGKINVREFDATKVVSQSPGRMVVDVPEHKSGVFVSLTATNPANPIRNIRFIMPGFEDTYEQQPFHPLFLERIGKFKVIRFMDWQSTNNSNLKEWAERTTPNSATQSTGKGVALEYMIQLANTLKVEPWFTVPHQASDDYVRQFAKMVRDRLDPNLKIHIEYSNEVWNYGFQQTQYAQQRGRELGLSDNDFQAALRYYSQRSVEIFKIWEDVFGGSDRLVRVLASQSVNAWTAEQVLTWKDAYQHADTYAVAPYFGYSFNDPAKIDATLRLSPEQILAGLRTEIQSEVKQSTIRNVKVASQYGLPLTAYEGGPHLTTYQFPADKEPQATALFSEVNRHPQMRDLYREYLTQWRQVGGGLFTQFSSTAAPTKWGFWGATEYQNQDINAAPKYQALLDYAELLAKP